MCAQFSELLHHFIYVNFFTWKEQKKKYDTNNNINWENAMNKRTHYTIFKKNESNERVLAASNAILLSLPMRESRGRHREFQVCFRSCCKVFQLDYLLLCSKQNANTENHTMDGAFHCTHKQHWWTTQEMRPLKLNHNIIAFMALPEFLCVSEFSCEKRNQIRFCAIAQWLNVLGAHQADFGLFRWLVLFSFITNIKKTNCQNKENIKCAHKRLGHKIPIYKRK